MNAESTAPRILISAGEQSGDQRAAEVIRTLKKSCPNAIFRGMGGDELRAAGVDTVVDSLRSGSFIGLKELYGSVGTILNSFAVMKGLLKEWNPSLLIVVDYPDFNLRLAKAAYPLKIPVLYYIPPKVWAWRKWRVTQLDRYCDVIASIFPFEEQFFRENNSSKIIYVGHPFVDDLPKVQWDREKFFKDIKLTAVNPTLALFAGSRKGEIERNIPTILEAVKILKEHHPELQGIFAVPNKKICELIRQYTEDTPWLKIHTGNPLEALANCDAGILKSGTCNLEAAFLGLPFVAVYRVTGITAFITKRLIRIQEVSIVNIVRSGSVKELLQENFTVKNVAREAEMLLFDVNYKQECKKSLRQVVSKFNVQDNNIRETTAAGKVAALALELISKDMLSNTKI